MPITRFDVVVYKMRRLRVTSVNLLRFALFNVSIGWRERNAHATILFALRKYV